MGGALSVYFGHHDSGVALCDDTQVLLHLEAERHFRRKHMRATADEMRELIHVGLTHLDMSINRFDTLYVASWNNQFPVGTVTIEGKRFQPILTGHHRNHIGTALLRPDESAVVVCADGGSEDGTTKVYLTHGGETTMLEDLDSTIMTGRFYGTITQMIVDPHFGRAHETSPGKTMGLAGTGVYDPELARRITEHEALLNRLHFNGCDPLRERFGISASYDRHWEDPRRRDLAATAQKHWEDAFYARIVAHAHRAHTLAMVGGCAYNTPLNTRLAASRAYRDTRISPVSGDCGQPVGAIMADRPSLRCAYPFLGRGFGEIDPDENDVVRQAVGDLLDGKILAWYQGRSEVGPRALGHRSFLGLPTSEKLRERLSVTIKKREPYRPVAPIIPAEDAQEWFDITVASPYMTFSPRARTKTRQRAPAIVHADGTSRLQTLARETNPVLHRILRAVGDATGVPILMNTSFNIDGMPIADTKDDAFEMFARSGADALYVNGVRYGG